jgi:uncharacterized protein with HEPN domain
LAVRKAYEVLGEIAKRIPETLLAQQPTVRWKDLKKMRDVITHRYDEIDLGLVWNAVEDLPKLRAGVEALLASLPPDSNEDD